MPYLNETGLSYYDPKLKEWISTQPVKTLPSSLYPWTLSEKAGAVTCWPVGGTELKPAVDFMFTETGPSSGTKGPDNPSTITGVSSITVTRCETVGVDETAYTVNLGSTYYGGTLDVASGVMTVTWEGIVFDGSETFVVGGGATYYHYAFKIQNNASSVINNTTQICSHLPLSNNLNNDILHFVCTPTQIHFFVPQATVSVFKAWLGQQKAAGTPLVVSYLLATPFTVQLAPTQILSLAQSDKYTPRLNTIYTDASAVQVGYIKSPIREEFELQQAIVAQGGNI
jgi:hypothetical protein